MASGPSVSDMDLKLISMNVTDDGVELLVAVESERRKGVSVAHSFFVHNESRWGAQVCELVEDMEELAWDVHAGWKREPKEEGTEA